MATRRGRKLLDSLPSEQRSKLLTAGRAMAGLALEYAVPIVVAPPKGVAGKINSATGFGLRLESGIFFGTAHHVLYGDGAYIDRMKSGERLDWLVGNLPPFDPLSRVVWKDKDLDVVFLKISENEASNIGPCIISKPPKWPPDLPKVGELALVAGYPKALREDRRDSAVIGAGPLSAVFRVTDVAKERGTCVVERQDLVSFDGPLPDPKAKLGGMSGAPVLRVGMLNYPLVGVVSSSLKMDGDLEIIRFATLASVEI